MRVLQAESIGTGCLTFDESLLQDLSTTLFQSERGAPVFVAYPNRQAAEAIEDRFALELAETYRYIKQKQASKQIQRLNRLL
ncbi:MAG: hypothetical protein Fur0046_18550 [Cyanobacteria bacterium J069]